MIPVALTTPPVARVHPPVLGSIARVTAIVLLLVAIGGAFAWSMVFSPLSFRRWNSVDLSPTIHITEPGTYVLFEEFPGAAGDVTSVDRHVALRSTAGRKIDSASLLDDSGHSSVTYRVPPFEGRALVSFNIDKPGDYTVFAFPGSSASGATLVAAAPKFALAPDGRPGWLGGIWGLLVLFVVPLLLSLTIALLARWRWPRAAVRD